MYNFEHFMVLYGAVTVPRLTTHCRKTVGSRDVHSAHTEMVKITVPIRMLKNQSYRSLPSFIKTAKKC